MYCPYCSAWAPDDAFVCPQCGKTLPGSRPPVQMQDDAVNGFSSPEWYDAPQEPNPYPAANPNPYPPNNPNPYPAGNQNAYPAGNPNPNAYGSDLSNINAYAMKQAAQERGGSSKALGVIGVCLTCIGILPFVALILSIIGLALSGKGRDPSTGQLSPSASAGRTCGIIGTVFGALRILTILTVVIVGVLAAGSLVGLFEELPDIFEDIWYDLFRIAPMLFI